MTDAIVVICVYYIYIFPIWLQVGPLNVRTDSFTAAVLSVTFSDSLLCPFCLQDTCSHPG